MKTYTIKKGEHYSNHFPKPYLGLKTEFDVSAVFEESCRYDLQSVDQMDINKLWGVSFGNHQKNSIRIGWSYNNFTDKVDLFYYTYNNYVRDYDFIGDVFIEELYTTKFILDFKNNCFTLGNRTVNFDFPSMKFGYYLFPYFGGNKPAPHEINIGLEVI